MRLKILPIAILLTSLSSCAKKNYSVPPILPAFPNAPEGVAGELESLCAGKKEDPCKYMTYWFNELYVFKIRYEAVKKRAEKI